MNDHPDLPPELTPPPNGPLPEDRKRVLRGQLLAAAADDSTPASRRPGWLVPGLAAAAVLAVVGGGIYLTSGHGSNDSQTPLVPAGTSDTTSPAPDQPKPSPDYPMPTAPDTIGGVFTTTAPDSSVRETEHTKSTADLPPLGGPSAQQNCADAVNEQAQYGESELAGATATASRPGDFGTTSLYETKTAWIVCDDFAAGDGGAPTLLDAHKKSQPYQPTQRTIGISQNIIGPDPRSWQYQYFAGGRDFDRVQAISYAFPDGHTENAVVGQNGLWSMNYQPTAGPLANPNTNFSTLDPIEVTVSPTGNGPDLHFTLQWGTGTCGQTNHGC